MLQNTIVLSLLIAAVIALRLIFKKKVSARIIYALWLAVVIKLCIPFSIPILPQVSLPENASVQDSIVISAQDNEPSYTQEYTSESETHKWENTSYVPAIGEDFGVVEIGTGENVSAPSVPTYPKDEIAGTPDYSVNSGESVAHIGETLPVVGTDAADNDAVKSSFDVVKALTIAWAICSAATALFFIINGTIFAVRLRRDRTYVGKIKRAKIYSTSAITTPCVFGIIPTVYIPPELNEKSEYDLAISHELAHISHGDNLWTVVRVLALIAYPWNPLMWAAAILSKRDAEFACDEAVTAKMSRDEKLDYAQMLVDSAPAKRSIVTGLGSAPLKERIIMLTKNRKKSILISVIAISLVVPCIFGSFVGFVNAGSEKTSLNPFIDVSEDAYYYDAVVWANQNNIMNGTSKTEFSPDDTCTRAEVVTCLWRMMGEPEPVSKRKRFYDVEESDSFYKAVMWAYKSGIARGTSTNYFSPSKPCTYAEVLTMVWRAEGSHWNVGRGEWYTDACNWANMMNLSCNACEGTFPPTALCPRRDVATLIYRSLKMNSVEEWMREYKGLTLGDLIDKGAIDYYAGTTDSGNRYFMTNYFGLYILTDGKDNDSKVLGAQFFGSNWVTENGISPLMKGVPANRNFNSWEKIEASSDMDGEFFTYCTDSDGNSVKAVWEISTTVYLQWKENTADLSLEERRISYTELVESNQSSPIGYVYTYFVTYPEEMLGEVPETEEKSDALITEGEVTVTSLDELKRYTDAGLFSPRQYDFYYDLISDDGEQEAFHSVVIPEFEITFVSEKRSDWILFKSNITFIITESDLYTLPVGEYEKVLIDYPNLLFKNADIEGTDEETEAVFATESAEKIFDYLMSEGEWRTPVYGECETSDYMRIFCYICKRYDPYEYSDTHGQKCVPFDTLEAIAEKEFGIMDCSCVKEWGDAWAYYKEETGMVYYYGSTGHPPFEIIDEKNDGEIETVTVQLFGDFNSLIPSYKVEYRFSKDGKWLGYEVVDEGISKPYPQLLWEKDNDVSDHALSLARYFREDVEEVAELVDHPNLWCFLADHIYKLYEKGAITLENISDVSWSPVYLIPNDEMKKTASLLLGIEELPEKFYSDDFNYIKDKDAFRYILSEPPMYHTECKENMRVDEKLWTETIVISDVDGKFLNELIYSYTTLVDDDWGIVYKLISITDLQKMYDKYGRYDKESENELITEGEVTVTSLDELKRYTDAKLFSQNQYDFYYDLISDDGEHEEFHSVVIPEFEITFAPTEAPNRTGFKSNFKFTVTESDLDTLPVGEYEKVLSDLPIEPAFADDYHQWRDSLSYEDGLVYKILCYLNYSFFWDTYDYGENQVNVWFGNYICYYYGRLNRNGAISYDEFCRIAKEEFGYTNIEKIKQFGGYFEEEGVFSYTGAGAPIRFDYIETIEEDDSLLVVVQLYSDMTFLLKSHKVGYRFSKDGVKWLGCEVLEKSEYEPYEHKSRKEY